MSSPLTVKNIDCAILPVVSWCSGSKHPENQRNLEIIEQWWEELTGKCVLWSIFCNETGNANFLYDCVVENTSLTSEILHWRKQDLEENCCVPVKELHLNLDLQELTIVPDFVFVIRYCVKYKQMSQTCFPSATNHQLASY